MGWRNPITWHPTSHWNCYMPEDDKKGIETVFTFKN